MRSSGTNRESTARRRVGSVLRDKWRLEQLLGVGGMGAVYEARHRNGSRAAIKVLHDDVLASVADGDRLRREAYIANRVEHPAVVRVLDDDESGGEPFLVMELVEGEPLDTVCTKPLAAPELLDVAEQVLDVLVVAHARGVIHRDLKPQNVLLDRERRLRILDFGIAGVVDEPLDDDGSIIGTIEYMAPELLRGDAGCVRSDLYALGAMLFELGSGQPLFDASCTVERIRSVLFDETRSLSSVAPHLDAELVALVDRATRQSPEARWECAEHMRREVRRLRARMPGPTWDLGRSERAEVPTRRLRTPPPSAVPPALLAAAAVAAALERGESSPPPTRTRGPLVFAALAALATLVLVLLIVSALHI